MVTKANLICQLEEQTPLCDKSSLDFIAVVHYWENVCTLQWISQMLCESERYCYYKSTHTCVVKGN